MQNMQKDRIIWRVIALIGLGFSLLILNIDLMIINLALPVIGQLFHANLPELQWINNIYSLAMASSVIFIGTLADRFGHRRIFLWGITLFFIGSCIAGFAFSVFWIIIGRLFQGVGMAATFTMIFVLAMLTFPKKQQGFVLGILVIFTGIGLAIGPSLGGFMIDLLSWRWAFLINIPICLVAYISIRLGCPKDIGDHEKKIHYASAFFLIVICFFLLFVLNTSQTLSPIKFWSGLGGGIVIFGLFLFWQKKLNHPLIDLTFFRNHIYGLVSLVRLLFQFTIGAFLFVLPLYLQNVEGFSVGFSGLIILALAASVAIISPFSGKLGDLFGAEFFLLGSQIFALVGFGLLVKMPMSINWTLLFLSLICIGINVGMVLPASNALILHELPEKKKGLGFGMFTAMAFFFLSVGIAVSGYILNHVSSYQFYHLLSHEAQGQTSFLEFAHTHQDKILPFINGANSIERLQKIFLGRAEKVISLGKMAFLNAFHVLMMLLFVLSLIGFFLSVYLLRFKKINSFFKKKFNPKSRAH